MAVGTSAVCAMWGVGLLTLSCGPPPSGAAPPRPAASATVEVPPAAPSSQPAVADAGADPGKGPGGAASAPHPTPIPGWGMNILVPQGSQSAMARDQFEIAIGWRVSVQVRRFSAPAPSDPAAVNDYFDRLDFGGKRKLLQTGQEGEVPFTVRRYRVRVGDRHGDTIVHRFEWVARVYATLPLDSGSHALCTGYLEYDADPDDAELEKVVAVCRSMQRQR